jgi:hypothetical protein
MLVNDQYSKFKMGIAQQINYLALSLIHLAGDEMPTEEDIQKIERKLKSIVKKCYLRNLENPIRH